MLPCLSQFTSQGCRRSPEPLPRPPRRALPASLLSDLFLRRFLGPGFGAPQPPRQSPPGASGSQWRLVGSGEAQVTGPACDSRLSADSCSSSSVSGATLQGQSSVPRNRVWRGPCSEWLATVRKQWSRAPAPGGGLCALCSRATPSSRRLGSCPRWPVPWRAACAPSPFLDLGFSFLLGIR